MTTNHAIDDEFVRLLTNCQNRLYVYVLSLVADRDRAKDILQETNVVMCRKAGDFTRGTSFEAWACKIAYLEVLGERRRWARNRKVLFADDVLEAVASDVGRSLERFDDRSVALDECMQRLTECQRERLRQRYCEGGSVKDIAAMTGETSNAVAVSLYRIRNALLRCIESKMGQATN